MSSILLVTEDRRALEPLVARVCLPDGWKIESCSSVADALEHIKRGTNQISLVLFDAKVTGDRPIGPGDVEAVANNVAGIPVIVLADGDPAMGLELAVRCGRAGAWNFFLRDSLDEARLSASVASALARPTHGLHTAIEPRRPESGAAGRQPAMLCFAPMEPGDDHVCGFALRLRGVSGESEGAGARGELEARQIDWARKVAGGIFTPDGGRLVELRYLASTSRDPAGKTMVTVYLVGLGLGRDPGAAETAARALWDDVESLTRLGQGLYQFWPVESEEDLRFVLRPFRPQHIVEIAGSAGRLVIEPVSSGPVGFLEKVRKGTEPVVLDLPLLSSTPPRPLRSLLEALAAQKMPLQVVLRLEPRALSTVDRSFLETLQQRLSGGRGEPWRIEYADGGVKLAPGDQGTAQEAVLAIVGGLADHFRVRCVIEAAGPIGRPLQTITADVLIGGDTRGWVTQAFAMDAIQALHGEWGLRQAETPLPARFRQLRPVSLAWVFLRLPLAGDGEVPGIDAVPLSYGYCPPILPDSGLKIGEKRTPNGLFPVYQKETDRLRHTYIIGQTGTGKSTLMSTMAIQDMEAGRGVSVLDPHGDLVEDLLSAVPRSRLDDVVLFDLSDPEHPASLNLLEYERRLPHQKTFLINEMMAIFDNLYDLHLTGGPMFESYMFNAMLLLMQDAKTKATLLDVPKVFIEQDFRQALLDRCQDQLVKGFWKQALAAGGEASLANMAPYVTSKLNQFVFNDVLRPIISQPRSSIDFRAVMDEGKILLVNLAKGFAGEMSSALMGMVIVARIMAAAMGRYDTPREQRRPHYLYVDEFQRFTSRTVPQMLGEVRKYGLGLILANQNLQQLKEDTVHAVLGNVGTTLFLRPGPLDAERIRPYVEPTFSRADLMGLPNFAVVGRLLVDDAPTTPFLFNTAWRPRTIDREWVVTVRGTSGKKHGRRA